MNPAYRSLQFYIYASLVLFIVLCLTLYGLFNRISTPPRVTARERVIIADTSVSATIGEGKVIKIFGYTSPKSLVQVSHNQLQNHTYADDTGYFELTDFLPLLIKGLCVYAQDQLGRTTQPVCLPPLDLTHSNEVGPILLPPTISLAQNIYYSSEEIVISGQTIPESKVYLSSFIEKPRAKGGLSIPAVETRADSFGNYSVATKPTSNDSYRLFVRTDYLDQLSPLSNKLLITVYPFWLVFLQTIFLMLAFLKSYLLEMLIIIEMLLLALYVLRKFILVRFVFGRHTALAIIKSHSTEIEVFQEDLPILRTELALSVNNPARQLLVKP